MKGLISAVRRNTIAEELGIKSGEKLIAVNLYPFQETPFTSQQNDKRRSQSNDNGKH